MAEYTFRDIRKTKETIDRLQEVTNRMADEIMTIRLTMPGKGINPVDSGVVEYKLLHIENRLRMLGANPDDPIPFK